MDKKSKIGLALLGLMFVAFVLFRVFYQKGAKLLADLFPWNYVALVIIVVLLCVFAYKATRGKKDESEEDSEQS